jgi:hypothetical protein
MREIGGDQFFEFGDQLMRAFGRKIESKELDGDETALLGVVRAKHGPEHAHTDLMKYAKRAESVRRCRADSVRVQRGCSSKEGE